MTQIRLVSQFLLAASGVARAALDSVEIAPGVIMPTVNMGGIRGQGSNLTLWIEIGGRGLDTAQMYGDDIQAELAAAVKASTVPREELFVTTKIPCCPSSINPYFCIDPVRRDPLEDLQHTYDVLGLDYVDLMLLHMPCDDPNDTLAAYQAMESLVPQGKARAIGISNFNSSAITALLPSLKVKPALNQNAFSVGNHNSSFMGSDLATFELCRSENITFAAYSPLGGLSHVDVLHDPIVEGVAKAHNTSTAQVALRWLIQQGISFVTATEKESHQRSDLDLFDFALSEEEMELLLAVGDDVAFV